MKSEHKELAIRALGILKGDDLARARAAFGHLTPQQMQLPYGQSGRTKAEILASYERHEAEINEAIEAIRSA